MHAEERPMRRTRSEDQTPQPMVDEMVMSTSPYPTWIPVGETRKPAREPSSGRATFS